MDNIKKRLGNLLSVKSLVTLVLTDVLDNAGTPQEGEQK